MHEDLVVHMTMSNDGKYLIVGDNMSSELAGRKITRHKKINPVKKEIGSRIQSYEFFKELHNGKNGITTEKPLDHLAQMPFDLASINA